MRRPLLKVHKAHSETKNLSIPEEKSFTQARVWAYLRSYEDDSIARVYDSDRRCTLPGFPIVCNNYSPLLLCDDDVCDALCTSISTTIVHQADKVHKNAFVSIFGAGENE